MELAPLDLAADIHDPPLIMCNQGTRVRWSTCPPQAMGWSGRHPHRRRNALARSSPQSHNDVFSRDLRPRPTECAGAPEDVQLSDALAGPMTVQEVLRRSKAMGASFRLTQALVCEPHTFSQLQVTVDDREPALRFCPRCWTLFGPTGVSLNPAAPDADVRPESVRLAPLSPGLKLLILAGLTALLVASATLARLL